MHPQFGYYPPTGRPVPHNPSAPPISHANDNVPPQSRSAVTNNLNNPSNPNEENPSESSEFGGLVSYFSQQQELD
jgi:hypothetical protein